MKKLLFALLLLMGLLSACQPDPVDVLDAYSQGWNSQDVEAVLEMVTDDFEIVVDGDPFFYTELSGKEAFAAYLTENFAGNFVVEYPEPLIVDDNQISTTVRYTLDFFKELGVEWVTAVDEFTITDGKVSRHVSTLSAASTAELAAAFAALAALKAEDLVGSWRWDGGETIGFVDFHYYDDGTYEMVRYISGSETRWDAGHYTIEGSTLTFTTSEAIYCGESEQGIYEMTITEEGQLQSQLIEDNCWRRKPPVAEPVLLSAYTP